MNYTPKSEEQLAMEGLLPEGNYDFEIIETSDRPSKKGNDMITLKLCVFENDGSQRHIFDYIALGNNFGERKLRRAAVACGLMDIYKSGELKDSDFLNTTGRALVKQDKGTGEFLPKNIISEYLPRDASATGLEPKRTSEIVDDDIPF